MKQQVLRIVVIKNVVTLVAGEKDGIKATK